MISDKGKRLNEAYDYLRSMGIIHTQKAVAQKMGAAEPNISSALNGVERVLTDNFLKRFNIAFDNIFNLKWLLLGEGDMLNINSKDANSGKMPTKRIKYYPDVDGTAGGVQFLDNPDERWIEISIPCVNDCTCAINVTGNSMSPLIRSGQIVLLSEWNEEFIDWGRIYLVITKNGYRCIKYLFPSEDGKGITCHSEDSENNPDFNIKAENIIRLFLVRGWICRDAI